MSKVDQTLHAPGEVEHALCGLAFDADDSGDVDEPVLFARPGEQVTCSECREHIDFVRRTYRKYRYLGMSD